MAEAFGVLRAENKRSLPAWMLKTCSGNQVVKTEDHSAGAPASDKQTRDMDQAKPDKRKTVKRLKNVISEGAGEAGVLRQCQGRKMARRASKNAVKDDVEEIEGAGRRLKDEDSEGAGELGVLRRCNVREKAKSRGKNVIKDEVIEIEEVTSKKPRKATERAAPKNSRKRKLENIQSEASSPDTTDDEIELTVEDLVSIAEEYVNADKQKQHEPENMKTARSYEHPPSHTIFTEADTGESIVDAQSMKGMLQCTTITRDTSEYERDRSGSIQGLRCSSSFKTTGDVAQDMINLFLGHLLNRPASNVKKPEPIESTTTMNHVPEKKDWRSEVPRQGDPVAKKKSSLKDKVALFL